MNSAVGNCTNCCDKMTNTPEPMVKDRSAKARNKSRPSALRERSTGATSSSPVLQWGRTVSDVGQRVRLNGQSTRLQTRSAKRYQRLVPLDNAPTAAPLRRPAQSLCTMPKNAFEAEPSDSSGHIRDLHLSEHIRTGDDIVEELAEDDILNKTGCRSFADVKEINLSSCHLAAIKNLEKFTNVQVLDLSGNYIRCIENLNCNKELSELRLYDNHITEIANLNRFKDLQLLHLQHNRITSIGKGLQQQTRLQILRLDFNFIGQLAPSELVACNQLRSLDLSCNKLTSIAALSCLPNLEELFVRNNQIKTIASLSSCKKLQELDISCNPLSSIAGLKSVPSLTSINFSMCSLSGTEGIQALGTLRNLEELYVSHCQLGDDNLRPIVDCFPQLQVLDLSNNCIESTEALIALLNAAPHESSVVDESSPASQAEAGQSRPQSRVTKIVTDDMEEQLGKLKELMSTYEAEFAAKFDSLRESISVLPTEAPLSTRPSSSVSGPPSSRPPSRSGVKSRLIEAQMFASQHFDKK